MNRKGSYIDGSQEYTNSKQKEVPVVVKVNSNNNNSVYRQRCLNTVGIIKNELKKRR